MRLNHHRAGSGEPLVLIHGIGSRWQVWEPVLERLQAEREVIALDLPGFAGSPMPPPGTPPGVPSLTDLVGAFLDELGLERPHVAGNSLGGWISLELAQRGSVRSATVLSPAGFFSNRFEALYSRSTLRLSARMARVMASRADRILASPAARKAALAQMVAHPVRLPAADAAASVRALADAQWFEETLKASTGQHFSADGPITVPVTIAWAEHDRVLLPRQARRAARLIPGARMITLKGCGHVPTYDDPEQVARVLLEGSSV